MIISRTPYRISFFGGGTDYPAWYREHGGAVVAAAIDKYCYLTCRYLPPFFEHRFRIVYSKAENVETVDQINHPAVREILKFQKVSRGVEIHTDTDLPSRSGMGSSSAFTVGLLHAVHALHGQMVSKHQLAMEGIHVEQTLLKENRRFAEPGDGRLRRSEPRAVLPQRRDLRPAYRPASGPPGACSTRTSCSSTRESSARLRRSQARTSATSIIVAGSCA